LAQYDRSTSLISITNGVPLGTSPIATLLQQKDTGVNDGADTSMVPTQAWRQVVGLAMPLRLIYFMFVLHRCSNQGASLLVLLHDTYLKKENAEKIIA
jgi:hypothetical protein